MRHLKPIFALFLWSHLYNLNYNIYCKRNSAIAQSYSTVFVFNLGPRSYFIYSHAKKSHDLQLLVSVRAMKTSTQNYNFVTCINYETFSAKKAFRFQTRKIGREFWSNCLFYLEIL